jgi:hypothetical protein
MGYGAEATREAFPQTSCLTRAGLERMDNSLVCQVSLMTLSGDRALVQGLIHFCKYHGEKFCNI